jgi:hypothetical protein
MRTSALTLIALAIAVAGCGGQEPPPAAEGDCAAAVRYHGALYIATGRPEPRVEPGATLSRGVIPACQDTVPRRSDARDRPIRLRRLKGISPERAVYDPRSRTVYHRRP